VRGGVLEIDRVAHVEAEPGTHGPAAFGVHECPGGDVVLGYYVIDGPTQLDVTGRVNALRPAEAILHEIRVVHMQVEERATGFGAVEEGVAAPGWRLGDASKTRGRGLA